MTPVFEKRLCVRVNEDRNRLLVVLLWHTGIILGTLWHFAEVEDGLRFTHLLPQNPDPGNDRESGTQQEKQRQGLHGT